jgi:translation elongation factor P/translation initiation factor 5A
LPAEFLHVKPGKGAAFVRTKLKNLLSNSNQEKTFRGGETVGLADVQRREAQFTYVDGEEVRSAVLAAAAIAVFSRLHSSTVNAQ